MYTSQRQAARIRLSFLRAVLRQEVGAFDTDLTNGKITSGISNHMTVIQDAIGEKVLAQILIACLNSDWNIPDIFLNHTS